MNYIIQQRYNKQIKSNSRDIYNVKNVSNKFSFFLNFLFIKESKKCHDLDKNNKQFSTLMIVINVS